MKFFRLSSRFLVGIVFIFSGLVKGVDPHGTAYRIEDYFIAFGWDWAIPLALFLSVSLSMLEFVLGVALIFNARLKQISWILLFLMFCFTILTFNDALYHPVSDCGCFGDAIKLTNWETFYKNIVLIVLVIFIFISRKKYTGFSRNLNEYLLIIIAVIGFTWFSIYQLNHLPYIDFRDWKIGNDMALDEGGEVRNYLTYRNLSTNKTKEFLSPDYPWNDSVWMSEWEFVEQRTDDSEVVRAHDLRIEDDFGNDLTDVIIANPNYQLLIVSWDLNKFPLEITDEIKTLSSKLLEKGYAVDGICSNLPEDIEKFYANTGIEINFYLADDIIQKSMIRANPGFILFKDGIILGKWHYNDIPDISSLESEFSGF
ncbi:MAG: DoxX family protein [Bacteroidetes bacterium]|nr:DoxX family protein [Bacteroidota bacterium]